METTELLRGESRFELQGADFAADYLRRDGMPEARTDTVWDAIALHTTPQTPFQRGTVSSTMARKFSWTSGPTRLYTTSQQPCSSGTRLDMVRTLAGSLVQQV
jgi:hypothetical protein